MRWIIGKKDFAVKAGDGVIVVAHTDAATGETRVWCVSLHQPRGMRFDIREGKGLFILALRQSGGVEEDVVSFDTRKKAEAALRAVHAALMAHASKPAGWLKRTLKTALVAVVTLIVLVLWSKSQQHVNVGDMVHTPPPAARTGVPVPADEVLGQ